MPNSKKIMRMNAKSVAFIGSAGVPNNYGGFEGFLENCTPLLVDSGYDVRVTCDKARYIDRCSVWRGVDRIFIGISANGWKSVFHDLIAFFKVVGSSDNIIILGVSGGIFFPVFRLVVFIYGNKLIVNIDGVEYRRAKFGLMRKFFLKICDYLAQKFSHVVVIDSESLRSFVIGSKRNSAVYIPYPGDHVLKDKKCPLDISVPYILTICRIEPENNCDLLLAAFEHTISGCFIFIGNWSSSEYGRLLRAKYSTNSRLMLLDPVYDRDFLSGIRGFCSGYIHGHSVGGTNPSLVEMLFYDSPIAAFDCSFNRSTATNGADYFSTKEELSVLMISYLSTRMKIYRDDISRFSAKAVVSAYSDLFI